MTKTFWESSQRPLFVRNVYVNGSRHAVLTKSDPNFKISRNTTPQKSRRSSYAPSTNQPTPRKYQQQDVTKELKNCIIKLQIVINNDNKITKKVELPIIKKSATKCLKRSISFIDTSSEFDSFIRARLQKTDEVLTKEFKYTDKIKEELKKPPPQPPTPIPEKNTLSERVLQWLDLAQANNIQIKINKINKKEENKKVKKVIKEKVEPKEVIKNEINIFPYKCDYQPKQCYAKMQRTNATGSRVCYRTFHRNSMDENTSEASFGSLDSSKMTEDSELNLPASKRQLHIFMPNLPKKNLTDDGVSTLSSVVD